MRKYILFLVCILFLNAGYAQVVSSLDSMRLNFEQDVAKMRADFEEYEAQVRADFERYADSIKNVWGGDTIVDNTQKIWVEYGKDYRSRSVVDFENGDIVVEITVDDSEKHDTTYINKRLAAAIEQMLNSRGSTNLYQSTDGLSNPILSRPALEGLVDMSMYDMDSILFASEKHEKRKRSTPPMPTVKGKDLSVRRGNISQLEVNGKNENLVKKRIQEREKALQRKKELEDEKKKSEVLDNAAVARTIVAQSKKTKVDTKGADGKVRQVVKVEMALVSDRISKSAALYKDLVAEFSEMYQIEQPLIFAIIETESAFQPKAVSPSKAYGLMQLVRTSGGRDAYRYVYKVDDKPEISDLFNPRFNIQLGTAYLRILTDRLNSVADPHCRRLCVIASYNTGMGNLSVAFIGNENIGRAYPHINALDYNGLYNHLITRLPYEETRNYVVKVTQKREKYMKQQ